MDVVWMVVVYALIGAGAAAIVVWPIINPPWVGKNLAQRLARWFGRR